MYKYSPFSANLLKTLIKGELWFGKIEDLNDPYEGEFQIRDTSKMPSNESIDEFYKNQSSFIIPRPKGQNHSPHIFHKTFSDFVKNTLRSQFGLTCFSKKNNDVLMWSHYADSHKGVCLIFDQHKLLKSLNSIYPDIKLGEVEYNEELPYVDLITSGDNSSFRYSDREKNVLLNKNIKWDYEEEYRLYRRFENDQRRSVPFDLKSLTGIIIGQRMDSEDFNTLVHLIRNSTNLEHLNLYKMTFKSGVLEVGKNPIHLGIIKDLDINISTQSK
ncbi:MAG: DUF2971 domain-containing protein [Reichenbachiella sp.]|uniref:DUF2971 domain-containing protein n=1 Tax=Reichenbachiella sp. TaxID=2184521 RepID=UPI0029673AAF|nr:DUF2971 domain-containing protein [Reichenbachiella sp.]MDW3210108.1 DUF2971 domain-containing protein [Reichenbachiella sp.]